MRRSRTSGFTLIELLVVVSIIALLISLLLPGLGKARDAAWTTICQSNERQIGIAIQMYFDSQRNPIWIDFRKELPDIPNDQGKNGTMYWHGVVAFNEFLSDAKNEAFECPAARGMASVRDPIVKREMRMGGLVYTWDEDDDGDDDWWTEYFLNDSKWTKHADGPDSGVESRPIVQIRHLEEVAWLCDAIDWIPRHNAPRQRRDISDDSQFVETASAGSSNLLFGDLHVEQMTLPEYISPESYDRYGAPGPFYNWGHYYKY